MSDLPKESKALASEDGAIKSEEKQHTHLQLDAGEERVKIRTKWWKIWIPKHHPPPAPSSFSAASMIPVVNASLFSQLTYRWITPIMVLGYQRTLQAPDLWKLDESRECGFLSAKLDESWDRRVREANDWNARLTKGEIRPGYLKRFKWRLKALASGRDYSSHFAILEQKWRDIDGRKEASLAWALNDTFAKSFWIGGAFKVFGDTTQLLGPLLVKGIINFAKGRASAKASGQEVPNIGRGIAMALGLFVIVITTSISQHQFFWRSMTTGVLARGALINSIYKRGVNLTGRARTTLSNSDLVNHISTDVSRIDASAQWFVTVCLIILLSQLGPSALAGFALFLFIAPIQERVMAHQFKVRQKSMKFTDQRAKTLLEVLGAMRVVKYFCYEIPFLQRISDTRKRELRGINLIQNSRSANTAFAYSIPVLAATLAFVTYTHTTEGFDVAVIFSSLSLFQLLRQPMMFLPRALSANADARNALKRLKLVFYAEVMGEVAFPVDRNQELALKVENVTFEWEAPSDSGGTGKGKSESLRSSESTINTPFQVRDINMEIPRGSLVAVVGRVGSGKSSLLQGLIGEMRKTRGHLSFGGKMAYCPQSAWIQNATLRDNILFGQAFDEDRYWRVIEESCLVPDLHLLPNGDMTEIGEKGINLSGGQKQRVNIARALYYDAEIILFDDPLSAVDAHVGTALFHNAILRSLRAQGKTVILVTHALHFLSKCDYIYTFHDGRIAEHGTFQDLVDNKGEFARLNAEFGGAQHQSNGPDIQPTDTVKEAQSHSIKALSNKSKNSGLEGRLIVKERRTTGSVSWKVYWAYLAAGRGYITVPLLVLSILLMQGSQIVNSYTLVWWQSDTFHQPFSFYQILYAGLGLSQALFTFLLGIATDTLSAYVSQNLHQNSIRNIFYAPMSFFDTTPMGRILGIFGKDIDTIDNQLPVVLTMSNVVGAVLIITILEHYFIIIALVISLGYQYFAAFYRASARELKRLDAMLRSVLYAHFSESLTGLSTIRSYGEIGRFVADNKYYIDLENRALFLTVTNQRWLAIRLDFCGAILVFSVAILAAVGISGISPAQVGLVLTYTTSLTQLCGLVTRQSAEVENYMNSVEREAPHEVPDQKPSPQWPEHGAVGFRAGKSSLALCLLRLVEFSGSITIDGVDISRIGLKDLRSKVSIIPQDNRFRPLLLYDDARLWDALRRSFLAEEPSVEYKEQASETHPSAGRITLDTQIESEGANFSVGERSLLSIARALVKDTKLEHFNGRTLLCIAHRLRTIIAYDRILVLDAGTVAEFDTPINLFQKPDGFFRGLCDGSNITLEDITRGNIDHVSL
ncbi:P-loop containing nucleoside triphosphate hydrolase protein [Infundibulicybe gibba]|nr:P-loop containing nucleoside triphosphate hydrolase protein [Infundibulicybe gibba]